jgi:hypothetical protein
MTISTTTAAAQPAVKITAKRVNELAAIAAAAKETVGKSGINGCCRVYVTFYREDAPLMNRVAKKNGWIFQRRAAYGMTNALYVGYDNCDGKAIWQGQAIAAALKAAGVSACVEYGGD